MAALKNVFSNRHMVHFGHQKNLRYKKVNTFFFSSKIFLPLNDHQLSIKEYNENVTDVSFVKGLIDTKTIQNMHYKLIACWRNSVQWLLSMQLPPLAGCVSFQMACSSLCSAAFWEVYLHCLKPTK